MEALEKIVILGVGAFVGARYLAGRITNNTRGEEPKPQIQPKNTGIVPPNFTPPSGFTGPVQRQESQTFNAVADGNLMGSVQGQLLQQMAQFRTVFA